MSISTHINLNLRTPLTCVFITEEYEAQKAAVPNFYPEAGDLSYVSQPKVAAANVDRMARDLNEQIAKARTLPHLTSILSSLSYTIALSLYGPHVCVCVLC